MTAQAIPIDGGGPVAEAVLAARCRRSLAAFSRVFWPVIEPDTPLDWNWHHDAICLHLEALVRGQVRLLLINVPPGTAKSTLVCNMLPAWVWTWRPEWRGYFGSYAQPPANRDSLRTRDIIVSPLYRTLFRPDWSLRRDTNAISYFGNDRTGWRRATSVGGSAGAFRGDCWFLDDPHNPNEQLTDAEIERANRFVFGRFWNRLNDLETGGRCIIMQRLHERDITGEALRRLPGQWCHLRLPAEYEPEHHCRTPLGWEDPRRAPGELLHPSRLSHAALAIEKAAQGARAYAAQYQQRPAPAEGALFRWQRIGTVPVAPLLVGRPVRYWDKAGTEGGTGARTAGVKLGFDRLGTCYILDVVKGRWSAGQREDVIRATAERDGAETVVGIEQEPGSGGKESAEATIRNLAGFRVFADRVTGDKVTRAEPLAAQVEAGQVKLVAGGWNDEFLAELAAFPFGQTKDQVDAAAGAYNRAAAERGKRRHAPVAGVRPAYLDGPGGSLAV